jgi:hypothetical protein
MTDALTQYLQHARSEGVVPSEAGFAKFKAGTTEERTTHPLAQHPKYTDAEGKPFSIGGPTLADLQRRKEAEEFNRKNARPVPASYALSEDTPEKRAAQAAHAQQIAAAIQRDQQES